MTASTYINQTTNVLNEVFRAYGNVNYLFHFLSLNPSYGSVTDSIPANVSVITDDFILTAITAQNQVVPLPADPNLNIVVMANESLLDVSTRYYGNLSQIVNLVQMNSNIETVHQRIDGLSILVPNVNNNNINVKYYNKYNTKLTTQLRLLRKRAFDKSFRISFN